MTVHNAFSEATTADPQLTVIIAADGDGGGLAALIDSYIAAIDNTGLSYEMILLYEDRDPGMRKAICDLGERPGLRTTAPRPWRGLDAALIHGIRRGSGNIFLTLPAWREIAPGDISKLIETASRDDVDMATGDRTGLELSAVQRPRVALTHGLLKGLFGQNLKDIFCRSRAGSKDVLQKVADLGVRQHFLPLIAAAEGYNVQPVPVATAEGAVTPTLHRLNAASHLSALVDMISLYVALKFLKRPMRFFGAIGLPLLTAGFLFTAWLIVTRLFLGTPLADRPALVFSVMMMVLGIQVMALGLIGEIIIFASSRRMRSYEIDKILRGRPGE